MGPKRLLSDMMVVSDGKHAARPSRMLDILKLTSKLHVREYSMLCSKSSMG